MGNIPQMVLGVIYLYMILVLIKKFDLHKLFRECSNVFRTYRNICKSINVDFHLLSLNV